MKTIQLFDAIKEIAESALALQNKDVMDVSLRRIVALVDDVHNADLHFETIGGVPREIIANWNSQGGAIRFDTTNLVHPDGDLHVGGIQDVKLEPIASRGLRGFNDMNAPALFEKQDAESSESIALPVISGTSETTGCYEFTHSNFVFNESALHVHPKIAGLDNLPGNGPHWMSEISNPEKTGLFISETNPEEFYIKLDKEIVDVSREAISIDDRLELIEELKKECDLQKMVI